MNAILAPVPPLVNPTPADFALADRLAWLADGGDLDDYSGPDWGMDDATADRLAADALDLDRICAGVCPC